ncbi:MAG: 4Fe-4S cluster-binding domain-containing protein [Gammaproteobacteria bacterium]|nr:4Fe-4S cluster-binding domain-containing protein [Gammaproteobacteria bacterium]
MPYVQTQNGKIQSPKLEYNLVDHCNFSCDECSHFSPFLRTHAQEFESFEKDLARLAQVYRVARFRFVGGEPLLNRQILKFVNAVRESRIADKIEVVTNGALIARAPDALFDEIDLLTVSAYPDSRTDAKALEQASTRSRRAGVRLRVERIDQFRRMQSARNADEKLVKAVFKSCLIAHTWYCQSFYAGYFYLCSRPIYTGQYLALLGESPPDFRQEDGVALHAPRLKERILAALRQSEPLAACSYCLGTVGQRQPWRQLTTAQRRRPRHPTTSASQSINLWRLRSLLAWRKAEAAVLGLLPSKRVARALSAALTAMVGD